MLMSSVGGIAVVYQLMTVTMCAIDSGAVILEVFSFSGNLFDYWGEYGR